MEHIIKVKSEYYDKIKTGEKIYEVRLLDEKRREFKLLDTLIIKREPNLSDEIKLKIVGLVYFDSFKSMAKCLNLGEVGFAGATISEVVSLYHKFYTREDEKKYGVVAIKIERE